MAPRVTNLDIDHISINVPVDEAFSTFLCSLGGVQMVLGKSEHRFFNRHHYPEDFESFFVVGNLLLIEVLKIPGLKVRICQALNRLGVLCLPSEDSTDHLCTGRAKNVSTRTIIRSLVDANVHWMRLTLFGGKIPLSEV